MKNRIRELRLKRGMTQRQLAEAAGTSQQQIQRIESGVQSVRFDLSVRIGAALEARIDQVFPTIKKPLAKFRKSGNGIESILKDKRLTKAMGEAGIDVDPLSWRFKFRVHGGARGVLPVSGDEMKRLWDAVQRTDRVSHFVVFDSEAKRIILNLDHLTFCQFLFDAPNMQANEEHEESCEVRIFLADDPEPLSFDVDPDSASLDDEIEDDLSVQLQNLVFQAEMACEDEEIFHFTDVDGEPAFFRSKDVAMIVFPLSAVEPDLAQIEIEEEEEGEEIAQVEASPIGKNR